MVQICEEYKEWVEETIEEPIQKRREEAQEKCKKKKCKKLCLCCNKWFCWIEIVVYWITEWVVRIIGKWLPYIICRIVSALIIFIYTAIRYVLGIGRFFSWLGCVIFNSRNVEKLPVLNLFVDVVIIDKNDTIQNKISEEEINKWLESVNRIFYEEARIEVSLSGKIRREKSKSLWQIDASSLGNKLGEWFKGIITLLGRESIAYLTVYVVGEIKGSIGLHLPLYGSVFVQKEYNGKPIPDTTLAHEIGHALLAIWNTYHNSNKKYLMYTPAEDREREVDWPKNVPKISHSERCAMRGSRWIA